MNLQKTRSILAIAAAGVLLGGCSGGGNGSAGIPSISSVNPTSTGKLQISVGTANIYGTATGLNVVTTYRQANGLSNVLVDTPTITGPFSLPASAAAGGGVDPYSTLPAGPSVEEVAAHGTISGTSQLIPLSTPVCDQTSPCSIGGGTEQPNTSTFGQSGGVFVNGLSPGNSTNQGVASSYTPYAEPMYDTTGATFTPFGGPPAFDPDGNGMGLRDGLNNLGAGVLGIPEGFTLFENVGLTATGTYTLSVVVPTGFSGSTPTTATVTATATLGHLTTLPTITAPTLTLDGAGGGSFTIAALPAGVTEEYVQVIDTGGPGTTCQGVLGTTGVGPVYYTFIVKAAGTVTIPDTDGPNTVTSGGPSAIKASPSICTAAQNTAANGGTATAGDSYAVQAVGLDYPMYEATYPINKSQSPTIAGASGQSDITISALATGTSP
jgi:hypothetical protein